MQPCPHKPRLGHPCGDTARCRICYLWLHDARYRKLWGGDSDVQPAPPGLWQQAKSFAGAVVRHAAGGFKQADPAEVARRQTICRGCDQYDGPSNRCRKCACWLAVKAAWESEACPLGKWDVPKPFVRNLAYHVYPVAGNGAWQWNLDQLFRRWPLFDGRKVISICHDDRTDAPEAVQEYAAGRGIDWLTFPNDPGLGEVVSWVPLWERLQDLAGPEQVTFYAHAKSVTKPQRMRKANLLWTGCMYEVCLDYWPLVERQLRTHPITGALRVPGWHYPGTFYWVRNAEFFQRRWRTIRQGWAGTEGFPGENYSAHEAGCIFRDSGDVNLYSLRHWRMRIEKEYSAWKTANAQLHSGVRPPQSALVKPHVISVHSTMSRESGLG